MMMLVASDRRGSPPTRTKTASTSLKLRSLQHLARRLAIPLDVLRETGEYADLHYAPSRPILKRDRSSYRTIEAPRAHMREVQRRIYHKLLADLALPDSLHAYRRDRSVVTAMAPHRGRLFWWHADIADFYPSITFKKVYEIFIRLGCSPDVAGLLTRLTTRNHRLPQGAPTSPALANLYLALFGVVARLERLADKHELHVTLFGDDIIVSSDRPFMHLQGHLEQLITSSGLRLSRKKAVRVVGPGARHEALGVLANAGGGYLDAPRTYRRRVRSLLRLCRRMGPGVLVARGITRDPRAFLRGKIGFAILLNPRNRRLLDEMEQLPW